MDITFDMFAVYCTSHIVLGKPQSLFSDDTEHQVGVVRGASNFE